MFQGNKLRPRLNHLLWMDVLCALCQNKSSDKAQFISLSIPTTHWLYHYPSILHWNIYNATVSSLACSLLFAREEISSKCAFDSKFKSQLILLFNLFLLLFISPIALFGTIHRSQYTISTNFSLYLQYFQQKVFSFSKINRSQTDPNCDF